MPTWDEFAWAVFLYGAIEGDRDYQVLIRQKQFLNNLYKSPTRVELAQVQDQVIRGFLNRWRCRLPNSPESAEAILAALQNADFEQSITVNRNLRAVREAIAQCYLILRDKVHGFGPTVTSKLLHVLQPRLFVMWDNRILDHYHRHNQQVQDSGSGYCAYLRIMRQMAVQVSQGFLNAVLDPPASPNQGPTAYLSAQMGYNPPKTMAKYLDEYNWVTIAKGAKVPPRWHPQKTNGTPCDK
jgi:hypothetical protein